MFAVFAAVFAAAVGVTTARFVYAPEVSGPALSPPLQPSPMVRLSPSVAPSSEPGGYRFLSTQPEYPGVPVAYDPCRPISVVVNPDGGPAGALDLVAGVLAELEQVTGLVFDLEGVTSERPSPRREAYQPGRYGQRWAPILVAWSDDPVRAGLDEALGVAASSTVVSPDGPHVYVTGFVTLSSSAIAALDTDLAAAHGADAATRVVLAHEFGHLLGLDHVDDADQMMFALPSTFTWGAGDLAGLARLGAGPCVAEL